VNILNKQSPSDNKGWPSNLGVGRGVTTPHRKKKLVMKTSKEPQTWTDFLDKRSKLWNTDFGEVGWGDVDWIGLAKDRNRWRALVNSVLNLRVP
jgi:hypothetical protein